MGMHVIAAVVGAGRRGISVIGVGGVMSVRAIRMIEDRNISHGRDIVQLPMRQGVRLGKLRGMQDRQLATAQHRHGNQRRDHDLFDQPFHAANRPASALFVKCARSVKSFGCAI